jgi:hypothetical protein
MARLMSQIKGGYYAAAPEAVAAVLERLRPPERGECLVLDPCAGEGRALVQLAEGLGAVPYGIELSEDRAAVVRESLPEGQSLAPADFLRTAISHRSFSFCWCNPPYDYATGEEGRVESQFIERAADLLVEGGVLALVCPEDVASSYPTAEFFEEHFERVSAMPFPEEVRKYGETIILGCKRKHPPQAINGRHDWDWLAKRMDTHVVYRLPAGQRPRLFRKSEPTDTELARLVTQSPLRFHIERPADNAGHRPRPPMSPGIGHRAMLLASGHIDGLICPADEPPHVIRGTAAKDKYVASSDTNENDDGSVTTHMYSIHGLPSFMVRILPRVWVDHRRSPACEWEDPPPPIPPCAAREDGHAAAASTARIATRTCARVFIRHFPVAVRLEPTRARSAIHLTAVSLTDLAPEWAFSA